MSKSRRNGNGSGNFPGFVRLHRGLIDHLPHFSAQPVALVVYNWALMSRDHRTGLFVADRRDISAQTGLSQWQTKRALAWLAHGRGCDCLRCRETPPDRPSYIKLERGATKGSPPLYYIRKDDSGRRARETKDQASGQKPLGLDEATPVPED